MAPVSVPDVPFDLYIVMPTVYSNVVDDLHLPLSLRNKYIDSPSTAQLLMHPYVMHRFPDFFLVSVVFLATVNH